MRLVVNATSYGDPPGGAGIRARELYGELHGYEMVWLLARDTPESIVPPGAETLRLRVRASRPLFRWLRLRIPAAGDVLLTDHYPAHVEIPTIVTLHDAGGGLLRRRMIRRHLRRASAVVAVSETVRRAWGVEATVIPNGVRPIEPMPVENHLLLVDPGIRHKDAATARATAKAVGRRLREVGRGVRWLERHEMERELARAAVVLCPSRRDGFDMVALEAMAAGRPIVVSDLPAHREVCGDAAFYAPPGDLAAWKEATERALEIADRPHEQAKRRADAFRWGAGARHLDLMLRSL